MKTAAVIGGGWYGCHIARIIRKAGIKVTILERKTRIFDSISGNFGIRLHVGPHYPRSEETRESCHRGYTEFYEEYPSLINPHKYSIYGLGKKDSDNKLSKIELAPFIRVCEEFSYNQEVNPDDYGYRNLLYAANMDEPSVVLGPKLRSFFTPLLEEEGILVKKNFDVKKITREGEKLLVTNGSETEAFDYVINSTGFLSLLPPYKNSFPEINIVYQPCIALIYKKKSPSEKQPFSLTIMDGWFPGLLPYDDREHDDSQPIKYILTHGKWTILGSCSSPEEASSLLEQANEELIISIKDACELDMGKFQPDFLNQFEYIGWKGAVQGKIKSEGEFRSAITFEADGVVHVVPGKISNIFDIGREVLSLIKKENRLTRNGFHYIHNGILDSSLAEIKQKPTDPSRNTCELQTLQLLKSKQQKNPSFWQPNLSEVADGTDLVESKHTEKCKSVGTGLNPQYQPVG